MALATTDNFHAIARVGMAAAFTSLGSNLGAMAARGHARIPLRAKGNHVVHAEISCRLP